MPIGYKAPQHEVNKRTLKRIYLLLMEKLLFNSEARDRLI